VTGSEDDSDDQPLLETPTRALRRVSGSWPVRIEGQDDGLVATDISERGIFVRDFVDVEVGGTVSVSLLLPGHTVTSAATVRWRREQYTNAAIPRGSGLELLELSEADLTRLRAVSQQGDNDG
jgi:hypothetical protein